MEKPYIRNCKYCHELIVFLPYKAKLGFIKIPVELRSLSEDDSKSIRLGFTVNYSPVDHTKHTERCPKYIEEKISKSVAVER